jgi:hypothetical protein
MLLTPNRKLNMQSKFRKALSSAFNEGELWVSSSGTKCWIVSVEKYKGCKDEHSSSYEVTYRYSNGDISKKDAWNFQVRYQHYSDSV